jgi:hypothetical protein
VQAHDRRVVVPEERVVLASAEQHLLADRLAAAREGRPAGRNVDGTSAETLISRK